MARSLVSGFLRSSETAASNPALESGGQTLSYQDLRVSAARIARTLEAAGSPLPPRTAVFASRSPTAFAGVLAALFRGHAYVPLNRSFPAGRSSLMLQRSRAASMIVDEQSAPQLHEVLAPIDSPMSIVLPDTEDVDDLSRRFPIHRFFGAADLAEADFDAVIEVDDDAMAYLLFTSGSTGVPKGVMVAHRNVRAFIDHMSELYEVVPGDRLTQTFDLTFDLSVFDMFIAWERGACVCCPTDREMLRLDRFVLDSSPTIWFSVPSAAIALKRLGLLRRGRFPSLRLALFCGEPLPVEIAEAWSTAAPNAIIENLYGPTELTIACTRYRWHAGSRQEAHLGLVPIGSPFPSMEAFIAGDDLRAVDPAVGGELLVTGPQTTLGYLDDAEKTAAAFPIPPGRTETFYRTGDRVMARAQDGPLLYLGRVDHQIKVRGYRVELGEIEAVLRDVTKSEGVVAVGWPRTEAGASAVEAFVQSSELDAAQAIAATSEKLPDYMTPRRIHALDTLPLNANGKFDRGALVALLEEGL
jgi:amino acid adenylation domain-containing protein